MRTATSHLNAFTLSNTAYHLSLPPNLHKNTRTYVSFLSATWRSPVGETLFSFVSVSPFLSIKIYWIYLSVCTVSKHGCLPILERNLPSQTWNRNSSRQFYSVMLHDDNTHVLQAETHSKCDALWLAPTDYQFTLSLVFPWLFPPSFYFYFYFYFIFLLFFIFYYFIIFYFFFFLYFLFSFSFLFFYFYSVLLIFKLFFIYFLLLSFFLSLLSFLFFSFLLSPPFFFFLLFNLCLFNSLSSEYARFCNVYR